MENTSRVPMDKQAREHMLAPLSAELDLAQESRRVHELEAYAQHGHGALTLLRYPDLRVVLMALRAGTLIREHQAEGRLLLHCLSGRLRLDTPDGRVDLIAGQLLALERGVPHDLEALQDSDALLTIAWQGHQSAETTP
jgi:quercetin dioxygenase-like cupin family protein